MAAVVGTIAAPAAQATTTSPVSGSTLGDETVFSTEGPAVYSVPPGTTKVEVTLIGGSGGGAVGARGRGAKVVTQIPVSTDTLYVNVATSASIGARVQAGGGASTVSTCALGSDGCVLTGSTDDPRLAVAGGGGSQEFPNDRRGGDAGASDADGAGNGGQGARGANGGRGSYDQPGGTNAGSLDVTAGPGRGAVPNNASGGAGGDGWMGGGRGASTGGATSTGGGGGAGSSFTASGFFNILEPTSDAPIVKIAPVYTTPEVRVTVPSRPTVSGQRATITAALYDEGTPLTNAAGWGTLTFKVGTKVLCSNVAIPASGTATCNAPINRSDTLGPKIVVSFTPTEGYPLFASDSFPAFYLVSAAATTTTVKYANKALTATVKAKAPSTGVPTGTVDFAVNGKKLKSVPLKNGVAKLAYTTKKAVTVTATYVAGTDHNTSSGKVDVKP